MEEPPEGRTRALLARKVNIIILKLNCSHNPTKPTQRNNARAQDPIDQSSLKYTHTSSFDTSSSCASYPLLDTTRQRESKKERNKIRVKPRHDHEKRREEFVQVLLLVPQFESEKCIRFERDPRAEVLVLMMVRG